MDCASLAAAAVGCREPTQRDSQIDLCGTRQLNLKCTLSLSKVVDVISAVCGWTIPSLSLWMMGLNGLKFTLAVFFQQYWPLML